jgi:hypothetical protein
MVEKNQQKTLIIYKFFIIFHLITKKPWFIKITNLLIKTHKSSYQTSTLVATYHPITIT